MASSTPPGDKLATKAGRRRLVQPVLPALPFLPGVRKEERSPRIQTEIAVNGITQEDRRESRRESIQSSLNLQNESINGERRVSQAQQIGERNGFEVRAKTGVSRSASTSTASRVPSGNFESSFLPANNMSDNRTPTQTSHTSNVDLPPNMSYLRSTRYQGNQITFEAPTGSVSSSPTREKGFNSRHSSTAGVSQPWATPASAVSGDPNGMTPQWSRSQTLELGYSSPPVKPGVIAQNASYAESTPSEQPSNPAEADNSLPLEDPSLHMAPAAFNGDVLLAPLIHTPVPNEAFVAGSSTHNEPPTLIPEMIAPDPDNLKHHGIAGTETAQEADMAPHSVNSSHSSQEAYYQPPLVVEDSTVLSIPRLLSQVFGSKEWVDWGITVSSPTHKFNPVGYHVHGLVIARSPILRQQMRQQYASGRRDNHIEITSPDRYMQPLIFDAAIRHLYDDTLLTRLDIEQFQMTYFGPSYDMRIRRGFQYDCALSYIQAGMVLGLESVQKQAQILLEDLLDWVVLEIAMDHALDYRKPSTEILRYSNSSINTPLSRDDSTVLLPRSSQPASETRRSEGRAAETPSSAGLDHNNPSLDQMLGLILKRSIFRFIATHLVIDDFEIDSSTPEILQSYLPDTREYSGASRHVSNPALASLKFGNMPSAAEHLPPALSELDSQSSTSQNRPVSAILLNASWDDLNDAFNFLKKEYLANKFRFDLLSTFVNNIVEEREKRRKTVLGSKTVPNQEREANEEKWNVVGWEESIYHFDNGDWELSRKWTGFRKPEKRSGV